MRKQDAVNSPFVVGARRPTSIFGVPESCFPLKHDLELSFSSWTDGRRRHSLKIGLMAVSLLASACERDQGVTENRAAGVSPTEIRLGSASALTGHASFLGTQLVHGSEAVVQRGPTPRAGAWPADKLISLDDGYEPGTKPRP